jgi:hypothetical protein
MEDKRTMVCGRCKKSVLIANIKYVRKGDDSFLPLCKECLNRGDQAATAKKPGFDGAKQKFRCVRCKYSFKKDPNSLSNLKCPFCGKADKVIEDNVDATSLLRDIESETFIN